MTSKAQAKRQHKAKPKSPDQIMLEKIAARARSFEAVGLHPEAAALPAFADVDANHAERERADGARRVDAFLALRDKMQPGSYDAARRLEADIALRYGEDKGERPERVDGGSSSFGCTDAQIDAGKRVDAVLARIGGRDAWLLVDLIRPTVNRGDWRAVVAYVTGESNPVAQGAVVRQACANLSAAYAGMEGKGRLAA
jgi:hypothetical protein